MSSGTRPCVHPSSLARGDRSRASSLPEPRVRLVVLAELYLVAWVTQTGHRTRNAVNGSGAPGGLGSGCADVHTKCLHMRVLSAGERTSRGSAGRVQAARGRRHPDSDDGNATGQCPANLFRALRPDGDVASLGARARSCHEICVWNPSQIEERLLLMQQRAERAEARAEKSEARPSHLQEVRDRVHPKPHRC